jgi:hypothetical protein
VFCEDGSKSLIVTSMKRRHLLVVLPEQSALVHETLP